MNDASSYRIDYGASAASLDQSVTVQGGSATSATISGLIAGTYYFAVTAVNSTGVASVRSNPVSRTVP
jgi:hypothetical protein